MQARYARPGAVSYAYPGRQDLLARIQTLATTYRAAGGERPVLLLHDESHGAGLIAMTARFGRGLPVNVIPLSLYSVFQVGHEIFASAFANGFERVVVAAPPDKAHDLPALESQVGLMRVFLSNLGYGDDRIAVVVEREPDKLEEFLYGPPALEPIAPRAFAAVGGKRDIARLALSALNSKCARAARRDRIAGQRALRSTGHRCRKLHRVPGLRRRLSGRGLERR